MKDYNSVENQRIKGEFVRQEVETCFSYEMDAILKASEEQKTDLPTYEDIENLYQYVCPECGHGEIDLNKFTNYYKSTEQFKCPYCNKILDREPESEPQEIFEWWIVKEYLYKKLEEKGEPVLEWGNNYYWGRTCTGQAILLDGVISRICEEMGILKGQMFAWAEK